MVSQTPAAFQDIDSRVDVDGIILYSARPRESGNPDSDSRLDSRLRLDSQHKRLIPNISAFTRVSTRYARE
jgi:hypothetical protein